MTRSRNPPLSRPAAIDANFAVLARSLAEDGTLAGILRSGDGAGIAVLPALAILGSKPRDAGTHVRLDVLAATAGCESASAARGYAELAVTGLVRPLDAAHPGVLRFVTCGALRVSLSNTDRFVVHGRLLTCGAWADLTTNGQAVSLALAADARTRRGDFDTLFHKYDLAEDVVDWLDEEGAVERVDEEHDIHCAHRVNWIDPPRLEELSGVPIRDISSSLALLETAGLVSTLVEEGVTWFHLPAKWWAPRLTTSDPSGSCR